MSARPPLLPRDPARIVVLRALFLGDLLCATPALRALRRRFPRAEITLIGLPWAQALVERLDSLDRLLLFPGYPGLEELPYDAERTAAFFRVARAERFDLALQMHGDGRTSNGFVAELGARLALGYRPADAPDRRLSWTLPYGPLTHEVRRWTSLLAPLDVQANDLRLELPLVPADQQEAEVLLAAVAAAPGPLVALHVGAKDAARRWPAAAFAALGDALAERCDATIVLTGSAAEQPLTAAVRSQMHAPALDLAGRTTLGGLAALVARLDLLVTNDTGVSHVAAAVGAPSVVLFGPSRPAQWAPLDRARHQPIDALALDADPARALSRLPLAPVLRACLTSLKERSCAD